jgi:hypothetical protein
MYVYLLILFTRIDPEVTLCEDASFVILLRVPTTTLSIKITVDNK